MPAGGARSRHEHLPPAPRDALFADQLALAALTLLAVLVLDAGPAAVGGLAAAATIAVGIARAVPPIDTTAAPREPMGRAIAVGARFVAVHPVLRPIALCAVFFNIGFFMLIAAWVPHTSAEPRVGTRRRRATMVDRPFPELPRCARPVP